MTLDMLLNLLGLIFLLCHYLLRLWLPKQVSGVSCSLMRSQTGTKVIRFYRAGLPSSHASPCTHTLPCWGFPEG